MSDSVPPALRERFDLDELDRDESTMVAVDAAGRIRWANAAWRRFAEQNGAPELPARFGVGASYFDGVRGPLRAYYERKLRLCLSSSRPLKRLYDCSSAEAQRLFHLRLLPLSVDLALFVHSVHVAGPHPSAPLPPDENAYRGERGVIVQCSNCRRVRRRGLEAWDWVPAWVAAQPARVSHGLCAPCVGYYYGDSSE